MTAFRGSRPGPVAGLARAWSLALALLLALTAATFAADRAQLLATSEDGFGRLVLSFPNRNDLPEYRVRSENGVLAIEFDEPIEIQLPDVAVALPGYVAIARTDPDNRGIRFGLRTPLQINRLEAGERLFVDLLPLNWQGLPPSLPSQVVAELAERARATAIRAEQERKAELARSLNPRAQVRVGRNPTFVRVQFDWSVDTEASFVFEENTGTVVFDWPVEIDLYPLKADLPDEIERLDNSFDIDGSRVRMRVAEGVVPRFYAVTPRSFIIDIDIDPEAGVAAAISAQEAAERQSIALQQAQAEAAALSGEADGGVEAAAGAGDGASVGPQPLVPTISNAGGTIRVNFPFERDTAAAVFRRGDVVWMLFETDRQIDKPVNESALGAVARNFEVIPAGATKIVRLDLALDRLATLGSEGRSWVLSLGDVLLGATEPVRPLRQRDEAGEMRMTVDLARPSAMHEFRDPMVGDLLNVVTIFPPARGAVRTLDYVDFQLLRSVHGLVVRAENQALDIEIEGTNAILRAPGGLALSALDSPRALDGGAVPEYRSSYIDLIAARQDDPAHFTKQRELLSDKAAQSEGRLRDTSRLELAQFYLANGFAFEAIGVLDILEANLDAKDLRRKVRLARGIADTLAARPSEALRTFNNETFANDVDALLWRTLAKAELGDFVGARADALEAETVLPAYPTWLRSRFLLSAARAAIETRDPTLAARYLEMIEFGKLDPEQASRHQLLQGRLAEIGGRADEALDLYGSVIAAEIRPTRAEAVYRTLLLLDEAGRIDLDKATETLSAEVLLWRGDALEADMQTLLARLYFRNRQYRLGFETVRQTVSYFPESRVIDGLQQQAQETFNDLYLNGRADELEPVEALALYYDFRQLTPPGVRGDEMIRNLAHRLVKVDLLTQAGDLLEYQMDSRLRGAAQSQIAADLAVIRIADRDPESALRALNRTRLADLPPAVERQRRILEARALIDAGRERLALDILRQVNGQDADLLRIEGYWKARDYGSASELIEVMYAPGLRPDPLLTDERISVVRAAVGFALANDTLALSRLRSKFGEQMARSPEWAMFDFVTREISPTSVEFRKVAREVSGLDSLNAFLEAYRQAYAASPMVPARASAPRDT